MFFIINKTKLGEIVSHITRKEELEALKLVMKMNVKEEDQKIDWIQLKRMI